LSLEQPGESTVRVADDRLGGHQGRAGTEGRLLAHVGDRRAEVAADAGTCEEVTGCDPIARRRREHEDAIT
jgi:hypothetical protein